MLGKLLLAGGLTAAAAQAAPLTTFVPALKPLLPRLNGRGTPGHVALTFDDGPDEQSTPAFLRTLDGLDVKATFFLLGEMCERYPSMARRLVDGGQQRVEAWPLYLGVVARCAEILVVADMFPASRRDEGRRGLLLHLR